MSSISRSLLASFTALLLAVTGLAGITIPAQANGVSTAIAAENISPSKAPTAGGQVVTVFIPDADLSSDQNKENFSVTSVEFGGTDGTGGVSGTSQSVSSVSGGVEVVSTTPTLTAGTNEIYITLELLDVGTESFKGSIEVANPQILGYVTGSAVRGLEAGGTLVTVYGENFESIIGTPTVDVGTSAANSVTVRSDTELSFETPSGTAGAENITAADGNGTITTNGLTFLYYNTPEIQLVEPESGFINGGETVVVRGFGFDLFPDGDAITVTLGGIQATDVNRASDGAISFTTPASAAGTVQIVVSDGTITALGTVNFTYSELTVASVSPAFGAASGDEEIEISGFGFGSIDPAAIVVEIGGIGATAVRYESQSGTIFATTPIRTGSDKTVGPNLVIVKGTTTGGTPTNLTSPAGDKVYFSYSPKLITATTATNGETELARVRELQTDDLPASLTPRSEGKPVTVSNEPYLDAPSRVEGTENWTTSRSYVDRRYDGGLAGTNNESTRWDDQDGGNYSVNVADRHGVPDVITMDSGLNCREWDNQAAVSGQSFCSTFGPDLPSERFYATAGDSLTFRYDASAGSDDYEIYAYLVEAPDLTTAVVQDVNNSHLILHEVGRDTPGDWVTMVTEIPSTGYFYFRFVNGTYDASGGKALGASMSIDPNIVVGQQNAITFPVIPDQDAKVEFSTVSANLSALSGASVTVISNDATVCTVSSEYDAVTKLTTSTITLNDTGTCSLTANSGAVGLFAPAAAVTRTFEITNLVQAPDAITDLTITEFEDGTASLGWTTPGDGGSTITDYTIQYSIDGGNTWITVDDGTTTTNSFDVTGLDISVQTQFKVSAENANGLALDSNVVESIAITLAEREARDSVNLEWTGPALVNGSAVTDYKIEYSMDGEEFVTYDDGVSTDTTLEVMELEIGAEYRFRITALNGNGDEIGTISAPVNLPAGFGAPVPFSGPVVTEIAGQSSMPYITESGEELLAGGLGLGVVISGTIDGKDAQLEQNADGTFRFTVPAGLLPGTYSLFMTTASGEIIEHVEAVIIPGAYNPAGCDAGSNVWTKKISETQAKVYMKCPVVGDTYSFSVQEDGVGEYETRLTRTLQSEDSDEQIFNSVGRYIVRTVELQEKTRIRIFVNGEKVWQVVYNRGSFSG